METQNADRLSSPYVDTLSDPQYAQSSARDTQLRSEANLMLIHTILHGVEMCITNHNKLLHASAKRVDLSR